MPDLLSKEVSPEIYSGLVELGEMLSKKTEIDRKRLDDLAIAAYGLGELR
jgi:hypothetical protein